MGLRTDVIETRRAILAMVSLGICWGGLAAVVPEIKAQIGASDALYGALMLSASTGALMAMWLAPLLFRLVGHKAIIIGALAMAVGFSTVGHSAGPYVFVICMLIAAAGSGVADVLANAEISEAETHTARSLMNLGHAMFSFSFALSAVLTGIARDSGLSAATSLGVIAVIGFCLAALMRPGRHINLSDDAGSSAGAFPIMLVALGGGVVLTAFLVEAATEGWAALHLERTLSASASQAALGPALFGLMMGFGRIGGHILATRVPELLVMGCATALAGIGLALVSAASAVNFAYLGFLLAGLGISVVAPLALGLVGRHVRPDQRLAAISRVAAMGYGAFFIGPPLLGALSQMFGLPSAFASVALLMIAVSVILVPALARAISITSMQPDQPGPR